VDVSGLYQEARGSNGSDDDVDLALAPGGH